MFPNLYDPGPGNVTFKSFEPSLMLEPKPYLGADLLSINELA